MRISHEALFRHQHLIMVTLTEAIMNEKREDNIYFDLENIEGDLDDEEEMKVRPQSANGDSIDQMSQDGNPKSAPRVRGETSETSFLGAQICLQSHENQREGFFTKVIRQAEPGRGVG